ncbi:MAG: hypothetical protein O7C98_02010 [Planctomycetota bacterium]|nr:hypothetical protein [Planctomycetota bacterium]
MQRWAILLLCALACLSARPLAAAAAQESVDRLVQALDAAEPAGRRAAYKKLLRLGRSGWPALERGLTDPAPDVRLRSRRLLQTWGWVSPSHKVLDSYYEDALRYGLAKEKRASAVSVAAHGRPGIAALRDLYYGRPPRVVLEPVARRLMLETGKATLEFRLRNTSALPGWVMHPKVEVRLVGFEPFAPKVTFPRPHEVSLSTGLICGGCIFIGRTRADVEVNNADRFEWLPARATSRDKVVARLDLKTAGVGRLVAAPVWEERALRMHIVRKGETVVPDIAIPVACSPVQGAEWPVAVLPAAGRRGKHDRGARLEARVADGELHLRVTSREKGLRAPLDLSSFWYVILDGAGRVRARGRLGGSRETIVYGERHLTSVPTAAGPPLQASVPLPSLPAGRYWLLAGGLVDDGARGQQGGFEVVSDMVPLRLPTPQSPPTAGR